MKKSRILEIEDGAMNDQFADFNKPNAIKHGLPAFAYTNENFFQHECASVLSAGWFFAGFVHEMANIGDVVPVTIAGKPVVLVRGENGIQAFHNVCSHRCMQLVDEVKNVGKLIRCPYHAWSYGLNGDLKASPHFGGAEHVPKGFDPTTAALRKIRTHVWLDWVFVNMSGEAEPFEEYASSLIKRLDDIDSTKLEAIGTLDFGAIKTNWKFIMENFIEPYHVQFVHKTTTAQPLTDHYTIVDGRCLGSAVDLEEEGGTKENLAVSSRYLTLFPNFIVGRYFPDQLGVYQNIPIDASTMLQRRVLYTTDGQKLTVKEIEGLKQLWWDVHKEDHEICERMQIGRSSPVSADGGMLSPHWEKSVRAFQELVLESLNKQENE